jgi:hypothetical protein
VNGKIKKQPIHQLLGLQQSYRVRPASTRLCPSPVLALFSYLHGALVPFASPPGVNTARIWTPASSVQPRQALSSAITSPLPSDLSTLAVDLLMPAWVSTRESHLHSQPPPRTLSRPSPSRTLRLRTFPSPPTTSLHTLYPRTVPP